MIIGLDLGGSTTDIVGFTNDTMIEPITVRADDPVTSAAGAVGKFITANGISLSNLECIAITGVGMGQIDGYLLGIRTEKVDEFTAIGKGGCYLTGRNEGIVASMGTGTAIIEVKGDSIRHWIGTGLGGGTILGLARRMLHITDINRLIKKAGRGSLANVDISIGDITTAKITGLPDDTTAANFAKVFDEASDDDLALGIINLVCQNIGVVAIGAARSTGHDIIILTGKIATIPQVIPITDNLTTLFGKKFLIPKYASYATAIGAALALKG